MPRTIPRSKDESFDKLLKILDSEKPVSPSTRQKLEIKKGEVRDVTDPERLIVAKIMQKMEHKRKHSSSGFDFTVAEPRIQWFKENMEESGWLCEPIQEATAWLEVEKPLSKDLFISEAIHNGLKDIYHYLINFIREGTQEKVNIEPKKCIVGYMVKDLVMEDFKDSDTVATITFSVAQTKRDLTMRTLLSGPDRDYMPI